MASIKVSLPSARNTLIAAQGLVEKADTFAPALERTGFLRTLGGVEVYLAARARVRGLGAADVHAAVEASDAQVVPAVRGCIYLVAHPDVPLAMRLAGSLSRTRDNREAEKAGIRPGEVEELAEQVLTVLKEKGPLTTDRVRRALPEGSVRSLGEAGKKVGVSSPLPQALRVLEFAGHIERTPEGHRLDTERYLWRATYKNTLDRVKLPSDTTDLLARLAAIFLRAAGLGMVKDFAAWAGVSLREANAAFGKLKTLSVEIDGLDGPRLALEEMRPLVEKPPRATDVVAFLPFEDNLVALQGPPAILVDPAYWDLEVPTWGGSSAPSRLADAAHLSYRPIVAEGALAGFWEFDPDTKKVVYGCLGGVTAATRKRLDAEAAEVGKFLVDQIGHAHCYCLDTDDELRKRAGWVRQLAAGKVGGGLPTKTRAAAAGSASSREKRVPTAKGAAATKKGTSKGHGKGK